MTAALLFAANFTIVFLLGVQQLTVQRGAKLAAFCISPFITGASIVLFKVLPQDTTLLDNAVHMLGGSFGIVTGMWMHAQIVALFSRRAAPVTEAEHATKMAAFRKQLDAADRGERRCETLRLARELADDVARSDIESFCVQTDANGERWYDTDRPDVDFESGCVAKALRYLELRQRVIHHPQQPHLVRFDE